MANVFVDARFLIAIIDPRDQHSGTAKEAFRRLQAPILHCTAGVIAEVLAHFARSRKGMRTRASGYLRRFIRSANTQMHYDDAGNLGFALDFYESRNDKDYSLVDCRSMLVMAQIGIEQVLTSDYHFSQEGFVRLF